MINYWAIIFLIAAGQGVFLSLLLVLRNAKKNALLSVFTLLFSLTLGHYVTFWAGLFPEYPHLIGLSNTLPWLFGPVLYFYVWQQCKEKPKLNYRTILHFVPFLIHLIYSLPYYILGASAKLSIAQQASLYNLKHLVVNWGQVVMLLFYGALILKKTTQTKNVTRNKWQVYISYLFIGFGLSYASFFIMVYGFQYIRVYDYYISVFMAVFIYSVGYTGFIKPEVLHKPEKPQPLPEPQNNKPKYGHSGLSEHHARHLLEKLQELMQTGQLYLNPALKMKDVADKLGISGHHLSQILNEQAQQNYADFVNSYRIRAAKQKLRNPQLANEKIIAIAYDVGFNTKASFNAHFKKQTGMSPSAYKKQFIKKESSKVN